ncbi:hypothetical protein SCHPADRAFT_948392 [Schizopora paradoxa]|uniref:Uncharacterized protein n=1 Tax=Schizopora paradoxa TaxID=27342 RepID=A0A0H2QVX6_9AGAM|nr:hypothetical protein SCHPADRAFT_948392 [Schizopora paradoxa]
MALGNDVGVDELLHDNMAAMSTTRQSRSRALVLYRRRHETWDGEEVRDSVGGDAAGSGRRLRGVRRPFNDDQSRDTTTTTACLTRHDTKYDGIGKQKKLASEGSTFARARYVPSSSTAAAGLHRWMAARGQRRAVQTRRRARRISCSPALDMYRQDMSTNSGSRRETTVKGGCGSELRWCIDGGLRGRELVTVVERDVTARRDSIHTVFA